MPTSFAAYAIAVIIALASYLHMRDNPCKDCSSIVCVEPRPCNELPCAPCGELEAGCSFCDARIFKDRATNLANPRTGPEYIIAVPSVAWGEPGDRRQWSAKIAETLKAKHPYFSTYRITTSGTTDYIYLS